MVEQWWNVCQHSQPATNKLMHGYLLIKCSRAQLSVHRPVYHHHLCQDLCLGFMFVEVINKKRRKAYRYFDRSKRLQKFQTFFPSYFA